MPINDIITSEFEGNFVLEMSRGNIGTVTDSVTQVQNTEEIPTIQSGNVPQEKSYVF